MIDIRFMPDRTKAQKTKPSIDNILRTVPDERAFYFYKGMDSPTGIKASNLEEFLQTLKKVDATSVEFHTGRHDFENWIRMLGDDKLSEQIVALQNKGLSSVQLHQKLIEIVGLRLGELREGKDSKTA